MAVTRRTTKQQAWIEAMLTGVTPTAAARIAKYPVKACKVRGCENVSKRNLMEEIDRRRASISKKTSRTVESLDDMYQAAYDLAMTSKQPAAAGSNVTGIARLYGMDKDNNLKDSTVIIINPPKSVKSVESEVV